MSTRMHANCEVEMSLKGPEIYMLFTCGVVELKNTGMLEEINQTSMTRSPWTLCGS